MANFVSRFEKWGRRRCRFRPPWHYLACFVHRMQKIEKIIKNCGLFCWSFANFVPQSEKLLLFTQKASLSNYRCHEDKYFCPESLVWKSFLDPILCFRSLCGGGGQLLHAPPPTNFQTFRHFWWVSNIQKISLVTDFSLFDSFYMK